MIGAALLNSEMKHVILSYERTDLLLLEDEADIIHTWSDSAHTQLSSYIIAGLQMSAAQVLCHPNYGPTEVVSH